MVSIRRLLPIFGATLIAPACTAPPDEGEVAQAINPPPFDVPIEAPLGRFAVLGSHQVKLDHNVTVEHHAALRSVVSTGQFQGELGGRSVLGGASEDVSVLGRGPVWLRSLGHVHGSVRTTGAITKDPGAVITGAEASGASVPLRGLTIAKIFLNTWTDHHVTASDPPLVLSPGPYDDVTVDAGATLQLEPGQYFFHVLDVAPGGRVFVDAGAPVLVNVRDNLELRGDLVVEGAPEHLMFLYVGTGIAYAHSPLPASVVAPNGTLRLIQDRRGPFEGAYLGKLVGIDPYAVIVHRPSAVWPLVFDAYAQVAAYSKVQDLPTTCDTPLECCNGGIASITGVAGDEVLAAGAADMCVDALTGDDAIVGVAPGAAVIAGDGNDLVSVGAGSQIWGGAGDDVLESLGGSIVAGNDGNDQILLPGGDNVVTPGPGADLVELGPGDDVVAINDLCEVAAGERLYGGGGQDTLVTPVPLPELIELGVTVEGFEAIVVEAHGCRSECREVPDCSGNGACVQDAGSGELSCDCLTFASGDSCEVLDLPEFTPTAPPSLGAVPAGGEVAAAEAFLDYAWRAQAGDVPAMRIELDAGSANPTLREAFVELTLALADTGRVHPTVEAIEATAYLRCQACENALVEIISRPIVPSGEVVLDDHHASPVGTRGEEDGLAVARVAIAGLVYQGTKSSRQALLECVKNHGRQEVRRTCARVLLDTYGDVIEADVAAHIQPGDQIELDRDRKE